MVLCLGEPLRRFLLYLHFVVDVLHFIFDLHFIVICRFSSFIFCFLTSSLTLPWTIAGVFTPHFILSALPIAEWFAALSFSTIPLSSYCKRYGFEWVFFNPQAFFTLRSFTNSFDSTCFYQGFPGSRQFFLEVCRALYWSSKHRRGPSACLIHSNLQKFYTSRFYLRVRAARIREESAPREIRILSPISLAYWKHFVLSIRPQNVIRGNELRS